MSPVNQRADFLLGSKPFMLVRPGPGRGRAWHRGGQVDLPQRRADVEYGNLPVEINLKEVWDDWSGGFGEAYREPDRPNAVHYSFNMDTRFRRQMTHAQHPQLLPSRYNGGNQYPLQLIEIPFPSLAAAPVGAGQLFVVGRGQVARFIPSAINTAGSAFDINVETPFGNNALGSGAWGRPAIYASFAYFPMLGSDPVGTAGVMLRRGGQGVYPTPDSYTVCSGMPAQGFAVGAGRLWRYHGGHYLQSAAADPATPANWSATLSVGDGTVTIADMVDLGEQLFIGMQDGLYAGDYSGTFVNVLPGMRSQRDVDNARDLAIFNNGVLVPHSGGMWWYKPSDYVAEAREVGPKGRTNRSPVRGRVRCITSLAGYVYAGLWTGSESYILAAPQATDPVQVLGNWHVMQQLPHLTKISRIFFDSVTTGTSSVAGNPQTIPQRMWVATEEPLPGVGTAPLYFCPVPALNDNPLAADPTFSPNYCGSARADFGAIDYKGVPLIFKSVEVWAENLLSGAQYADIYYTLDGGTRATLGRVQTSPRSILYFSQGEGSFVTGRSIALSVESFTGSLNVSPVYKTFMLNAVARPNPSELITAVVRVADEMRDRQGGKMRSGAAMLEDLRSFADPAREGNVPQRLIDLAGATSWVAVLAPIEEEEYYQQGSENPEIAATVKLAVLEFSGQV